MTILVISGPPGSGKTQMAQHLSWMFNDADEVVVFDEIQASKKPKKIPEKLIVTCQLIPEWVKQTDDYIVLHTLCCLPPAKEFDKTDFDLAISFLQKRAVIGPNDSGTLDLGEVWGVIGLLREGNFKKWYEGAKAYAGNTFP